MYTCIYIYISLSLCLYIYIYIYVYGADRLFLVLNLFMKEFCKGTKYPRGDLALLLRMAPLGCVARRVICLDSLFMLP